MENMSFLHGAPPLKLIPHHLGMLKELLKKKIRKKVLETHFSRLISYFRMKVIWNESKLNQFTCLIFGNLSASRSILLLSIWDFSISARFSTTNTFLQSIVNVTLRNFPAGDSFFVKCDDSKWSFKQEPRKFLQFLDVLLSIFPSFSWGCLEGGWW